MNEGGYSYVDDARHDRCNIDLNPTQGQERLLMYNV